jgi:hypothetical protein
MRKLMFVLSCLIVAALFGGPAAKPAAKPKSVALAPAMATPVSVYGAWHCGNEFCSWASVRNMTDFDTRFANAFFVNESSAPASMFEC